MQSPRPPSAAFALAALTALAGLAACADSRDVVGVAAGASACVGCHGGLADDSGAPPFDAHGLTSSAAVGAHTRHLAAGVACASCHVVPTQVAFPRHLNGVADVTFGPAAQDPASAATPVWNAATRTCANVYCHAPSTAPGGTVPVPQWTGSISGCTACHEGPATIHGGGIAPTACVACHETTVTGAGAIVPGGGAHANGAIDTTVHDPGWAVTNASGVTPHGMAALYRDPTGHPTGLAGCRSCHGSTLDNPVASGIPSCDSCHQPYALPGTAGSDWRTDCTFCHGDRSRAAPGALVNAAPPRDVQGNAASIRAGVHLSHVAGATLSRGVACTSCHPVPAGLDDHVTGVTTVALRTPLGAPSGTFTPRSGTTAATCTTYCHDVGDVSTNTPSWTGAGTQAACTSCHGFSPRTGRHPSVSGSPHDYVGTNCSPCHRGVATNAATSQLDPTGLSSHVNGVKDVAGTLIYRWDGATHRCYGVSCHGDTNTEYKTW